MASHVFCIEGRTQAASLYCRNCSHKSLQGTSMARRALWSTESLKLATNPDTGVRLSQRALWYWDMAVQTAWVPIGTHWRIFEIRTVEWKCLASIGWAVVQFKQRMLTACRYVRISQSEISCGDVRWLQQNWPGKAHSCGWWQHQRPCTSGQLTLRANDWISIHADAIPQHNRNWHIFVSFKCDDYRHPQLSTVCTARDG